jgi:hypothetical protein
MTSAIHACGSISFILQLKITVYMKAALKFRTTGLASEMATKLGMAAEAMIYRAHAGFQAADKPVQFTGSSSSAALHASENAPQALENPVFSSSHAPLAPVSSAP